MEMGDIKKNDHEIS